MVDVPRATQPGRSWIPGWSSLRSLEAKAVPREIAAGLSVAAVAVPVSLALAALMGVPPVYGLYASIFPMLAYALFGPARYLIVGPDTATCLLVASALTSLGWQDPDQRIVAASALALIAGVAFGLAGVARLGFIAQLLSRPILVGYMAGVALTLLISQISSFTGVNIDAPGLVRPIIAVVQQVENIHVLTLMLAVGFFLALLGFKHFAPRLPGPVIVVVAAILLSWGLDLPSHGVAVIGAIPSGLPAPAFPSLDGRLADLGISALGLFFVSFVSGVITSRSFGQRLGVNDTDANLELRGFAAANLAAGLFQGFPVTGADSRTAVNLSAGGRTALAPIVASLVLVIVVAALTAPLTLLPKAALGAILATSALGLLDFNAFRQLARIGPQELIFALVGMAGVIWVGVLQGVFLAIVATFIHLLALSARPRHSRMGWGAEGADPVSLDQPWATRPPSEGVVFSFEASLLFVNVDYFRMSAVAALADAPGARWFVLDASSIPYADSTAVATLLDLNRLLQDRGVNFAIAHGHGRFHEILDRGGVVEALTGQAIHPTTSAAVRAMRALSAPTSNADSSLALR